MAETHLAILIKARDEASAALKGLAGNLAGLEKAAIAPQRGLSGLLDGFGKLGLAGLGISTAKAAFEGLASAVAGPINAASDLNESMSKVDVIFGQNAAAVREFAATSAQALGQSKGEALSALGGFGNLFKAMGLGGQETLGLSTKIVSLGSDLASFHNVMPTEALEKLRAGLVGESEPLRSLGININEAGVKAKAMELGLAGANGELTEAAKVQSRYALILEQSRDAQGDFSRTSTGLANAQRIISASFADIQAQIGTQLLPLVAPLVSAFATQLPGALTTLQGVLSSLQGPIQVVQGALEALFGLQNTDSLQLGLEKIFGADSPLVGGAMDAILGTVDGLRGAFETLGAVLGTVASVVTDTIAPALGEHFTEIMTAAGAMLTAVVVPAFIAWAVSAGAAAAATIVALAPVLVPLAAIGAAAVLLRAAWESNWGDIQGKTASVWATIQPIFAGILAEVGRFTTEMLPLATAAWTNLSGAVTGIASALWAAIQAGVSGLVSFWESNHATVEAVASAVWTAIKLLVEVNWIALQGIIKAGLQVLSGDWSGAWETMRDTAAATWGAIIAATAGAMETLVGSVNAAFQGMISAAASAGSGLVQAFANNVTAQAGAALSAVQSIVQQIRDLLPGSDAKVGPLRDLTKSGQALSRTFARGVDQTAYLAREAVWEALPPVATGGAFGGRSGAGGGTAAGGGGSVVNVYLTVTGSVTTENDLVECIRRGLIQTGRRNGYSALGGLA